jgi:hypothetical protein
MTRKLLLVLATILILGVGIAAVTVMAQEDEQETRLQFSDLPEAVQQAVLRTAGDAEILAVSSEAENGRTEYEVVVELEFDASGNRLAEEAEDDDDNGDDAEDDDAGDAEDVD